MDKYLVKLEDLNLGRSTFSFVWSKLLHTCGADQTVQNLLDFGLTNLVDGRGPAPKSLAKILKAMKENGTPLIVDEQTFQGWPESKQKRYSAVLNTYGAVVKSQLEDVRLAQFASVDSLKDSTFKNLLSFGVRRTLQNLPAQLFEPKSRRFMALQSAYLKYIQTLCAGIASVTNEKYPSYDNVKLDNEIVNRNKFMCDEQEVWREIIANKRAQLQAQKTETPEDKAEPKTEQKPAENGVKNTKTGTKIKN